MSLNILFCIFSCCICSVHVFYSVVFVRLRWFSCVCDVFLYGGCSTKIKERTERVVIEKPAIWTCIIFIHIQKYHCIISKYTHTYTHTWCIIHTYMMYYIIVLYSNTLIYTHMRTWYICEYFDHYTVLHISYNNNRQVSELLKCRINVIK